MAKVKDDNLAAQNDAANLKAAGHEGVAGKDGTVGVDGEKPKNDELNAKVTVNDPDLKGARDVVQERQDKLSESNEEGHAKNMAAIEKAHEGGETVETEDGPIAAPDSKLGREDNGNTPRINADGSKSWGVPGVAGAAQ